MLALLLKLTLAPALVAVATAVARRMGNRAGGLVSGIPVVAGPIVLVYAVEHGEHFAKTAAAAAVLGMLSQIAFCVVYALVARGGASFVVALVASSLTFVLGTVLLSGVDPPLGVSIVLTLAAIGGASWAVRRLGGDRPNDRPRNDLLGWRLVITAALVVALTAVAGDLSPHVAGLLVPVPILTGVLAAFTQAQAGPDAAIELLGGLLLALVSFLMFFATLAPLLLNVSAVAAFGLAAVASLACWGVLAALDTNGSRLPAR